MNKTLFSMLFITALILGLQAQTNSMKQAIPGKIRGTSQVSSVIQMAEMPSVIAKPETVYLAPAKEEKLFENQFHYYDLTLKLVSALIGLLGVLIGALSLLAGLGGYIFYRDRKTMRDEIAANAKAEVDISSKEFQSKLKDQMHALESLVDQ